jgi:hypothetical protein
MWAIGTRLLYRLMYRSMIAQRPVAPVASMKKAMSAGALGLARHLLGGGRELLRGRGVPLRDLVDLGHRPADLADAGRLLLARRGDLLDEVGRSPARAASIAALSASRLVW